MINKRQNYHQSGFFARNCTCEYNRACDRSHACKRNCTCEHK